MIELIAKSPADGLLPVTIGALSISELAHEPIHSIAPLQGARPKGFPAVGRCVDFKGGRLIWTARGQFFLIGATPPKTRAAITDQSDAWCRVALTGARAADALARLCPLNAAKMQDGDVARSLIGHMPAIILRTDDGFEIMVFRAFARTLVHELSEVMTSIKAQENIGS